MSNNIPASNLLPLHVPQYSAEQKIAFLERELAAAKEMIDRQNARNAELAQKYAALTRKADIDPKTGLLNEDFMNCKGPEIVSEQARRYDRQSKGQLIVAYVDVDGLKAVNDSGGHNAGDELIKTMAQALKTNFKRKSDQYLIRKSGDEFVLILKNCTPDYVRNCLEQLNNNTSFVFNEKRIDVRCSYGYSVFQGQSFEEMLAEADAALYRNKAANKNENLSTTITNLSVSNAPTPPMLQPA